MALQMAGKAATDPACCRSRPVPGHGAGASGCGGGGGPGAPPSRCVSQWSDPAQLSGVPGREADHQVDGTYHMWYCPALQDENTLYRCRFCRPERFPTSGSCHPGLERPVNLAEHLRLQGGAPHGHIRFLGEVFRYLYLD